MRSIFFNGRHDNICLVCAAQYMMEVDVSLRTNIDYIFTMRENILTNRQKLYKYYFGQFSSFSDFDKVMTACTQDYRALVLDGTLANNANPTDCVMWYRASTEVPAFRLCRPVYWSWARRYGRSDSAVRAAQTRAFEIEAATAEALALSGAAGEARRARRPRRRPRRRRHLHRADGGRARPRRGQPRLTRTNVGTPAPPMASPAEDPLVGVAPLLASAIVLIPVGDAPADAVPAPRRRRLWPPAPHPHTAAAAAPRPVVVGSPAPAAPGAAA